MYLDDTPSFNIVCMVCIIARIYLLAHYAIFIARWAGAGVDEMRYPVVIHKDKSSD